MRIYKPTRKDKQTGKLVRYDRWYLDFHDHLDRRHRWPGFTDKNLTETVGRNVEALVRYKLAHQQPDPTLAQWLEKVPEALRDRLVKANILNSKRAAGAKNLSKHLEDFRAWLRAKGNTEKHVKMTCSRIKSVLEGCKLRSWSSITASKVQCYLSSLREDRKIGNEIIAGINAKTFNAYLGAIKQFCKWMVEDRRAAESPIAHLKKIEIGKVKSEQRRNRRVLEIEQFRCLLSVTMDQPARYGMTGPQRAMAYRVAAETGLRANEMRGLTVSSFDLEHCSVTVQGNQAKNRKTATLPIRSDTAAALEPFVRGKLPHVQLFPLPDPAADMLKEDLKAAQIPYEDDSGLVFDFHSLRHQTGTMLAAAGVAPKVAQTLLRHSDINLTMGIYSHTLTGQESQAVESLPDLSPTGGESQKKTGTDDKSCVATSVANLCGDIRSDTKSSGKPIKPESPKTPFLTSDGETRTHDLRAMNPPGRIVNNCE